MLRKVTVRRWLEDSVMSRRRDHRVHDDLVEVCREAGDRLVDLARVVEDGPGVGALEAEGKPDRKKRGTCVPALARLFRVPTSAFRVFRSHAPTDAGSATRRPITSAITRISRISWANWSGKRV